MSFRIRPKHLLPALFLSVFFSASQGFAQCTAEGGNIALDNGATEVTILVDGVGDPLNVNLDGTQMGGSSAWVITDADLNILALPPAPPFDLDGAGIGTCLIWYLRFDGMISGAEVGMNAANLDGCFDLSNPITVDRVSPDAVNGGNLTFADGTTQQTICADGIPDPLDVMLDGTQNGESSAWVVTDEAGNILALPPAPPFDFDPAGPGTCLIWYLRWNGQLTGAAVGNNASDLAGDFDLSNPIAVQRNQPEGGNIALDNGATEVTIVVDGVGDPLNVNLDGTQMGGSSAWVITDADLNILALPPAPPFDLDGAGIGTCLIWYLRFDGMLSGAEVGMNAANLDGCFDLSNPITVDRVAPPNGMLATGTIEMPSGATERFTCPGEDIMIQVVRNYTVTTGDVAYFITDSDFRILGISDQATVDLTGAPVGTCFIYAVNYTGDISVANGAHFWNDDLTSGDDQPSQNRITVVRQDVEGGTVETQEGETEVIVCRGWNDFVGFRAMGTATGTPFTYVITDEQNNILGINSQGFENFGQAPSGVCRVWGLSYTGNIIASAGDNAAAVDLTDNCWDLSENFITVTRYVLDGGNVLVNGSERTEISAGNTLVSWTTTQQGSAPYAYFILNRNQEVEAITFDQSFDFEPLTGETYYIYGMSHAGNVLINVGDFFWDRPVTDECYERSDNAIVVTNLAALRPQAGDVHAIAVQAISLPGRQIQLNLENEGTGFDESRINLLVSDSYGRVLLRENNLPVSNLSGHLLDLANYPAGLYFISTEESGRISTTRVITH